jgi:hypothetical protein
MKRRKAAIGVAVVAVLAFAFFAPVVKGVPVSQIDKCGLPTCSPNFIETYSSITYYYYGYGAAYYPIINNYRVFL